MSGIELNVRLVERLDYTPALMLATAGWMEIEQKGFGDGVQSIGGSQKAFLAYVTVDRDELPIGVITWQVDNARLWVCQSYVVPEYRGRGVYREMWLALVNHAVENLPEVRAILSGVALGNDAMRKVARRLGRVETGVILETLIER